MPIVSSSRDDFFSAGRQLTDIHEFSLVLWSSNEIFFLRAMHTVLYAKEGVYRRRCRPRQGVSFNFRKSTYY